MSSLRTVAAVARLAVATIAALTLLLALTLPQSAAPASAAAMLAFPAPAGTEWAVLAGYNTFTHSVADANDPWALDLHRIDGPTDGTPVLAPVSGTVSFVSSSCVTIRDGAGTRLLMCHILAPASLRNTTVSRGQQIGTVAPPGEAGNNGASHIHLALTAATGGPMPFTGNYALEGVSLPPTTEPNAYADTTFRSTIVPAPVVNAGIDQSLRPRTATTLIGSATNPAGGALRFQWTQVSGTNVALASPASPATTFTTPSTNGTLEFRFTVTDDTGDSVSDTVTVRVSTSASVTAASTPPSAGTTTSATGRIEGGSIPATGGVGIVVFGGGTSDQLLTASGCPRETAAFWATVAGNFVTYVPGSSVSVVNQPWNTVFASGLPFGTALIGKCR